MCRLSTVYWPSIAILYYMPKTCNTDGAPELDIILQYFNPNPTTHNYEHGTCWWLFIPAWPTVSIEIPHWLVSVTYLVSGIPKDNIYFLPYIFNCARFKQKQRLGCTQSKAEVCALPHQCLSRLHTSVPNCAHPSRCFCLNRAQI